MTEQAPEAPAGRRARFAAWRRTRPFAGAVLTVLSGLVLWFSGRLRIDGFEIQLGIEGMQATLLPLVLVLLGALLMAQPQFRVFYGVITIGIAVYSLLGVNLGGFGIGMVLGVVGGILAVSWLPRDEGGSEVEVAEGPEPTSSPEPSEVPVPGEIPAPGDAPTPLQVPDGGARHSAGVAALAALALAVAPLPAAPVRAEPLPAGHAAAGPVRGPVLCDWFGVTCPDEPDDGSGGDPSPSPSASDPGPDPGDTDDGGGTAPDEGSGAEPGDGEGAEPDAAADEPQDSAGDEEQEEKGDEPAPPAQDGPPVTDGGHEDADVFSVPGELKAEDLRMEGLQSVSVVSVPAATPSGRRLALKIVADRVELDGFWLKTFADGGTGGTVTEAGRVTLDGDATMYLTSLSAGLPDGERLVIDPEDPPTLTGWLLALANPTIGFLGAVSEEQVWSDFREQVWED